MPKRRSVQYIILIFSLLLLGIWGIWQTNLVYAKSLVATSDVLQNYTHNLQANEVLHYFTTEYYRIDPNYVEPADPYHKPLLPLLKANRITEVWLTQEYVHSVTKLDDVEQTLVKEFISLPSDILYYDAIQSNLSKIPSQQQEASSSSVSNTTIDQVSWISGLKQSNWGRMAWVVKFQPTKLTPKDFSALTLKTASIMPQAADLAFDEVQTVWEIDQETGLLITMQQLALTANSPTVIYSITNTLPEKLQKSDLTFDPEKFIASAANETLGGNGQTTSGDTAGLITNPSITPEQISKQTGLPVYIPDQSVLSSWQPKFQISNIFYNPLQACNLQRNLAFDFELCSGLGQNIKQEYMFANSDTFEDVEGIYIAQEPLEAVKPLLTNAFPRWYESRAIPLKIMNKDVQGWQATIKNGDQIVNSLFFQLNNTFVQLNGYGHNGAGISLEKLVTVAESLHPVIANTNNTTLFIPLIQN